MNHTNALIQTLQTLIEEKAKPPEIQSQISINIHKQTLQILIHDILKNQELNHDHKTTPIHTLPD